MIWIQTEDQNMKKTKKNGCQLSRRHILHYIYIYIYMFPEKIVDELRRQIPGKK